MKLFEYFAYYEDIEFVADFFFHFDFGLCFGFRMFRALW